MPIKILNTRITPMAVLDQLDQWGIAIHNQRMLQRMRRADLCARAAISVATLRRIEMGDSTVNIGAYMTVLNILGILKQAAPDLPETLLKQTAGKRVRLSGETDEYF